MDAAAFEQVYGAFQDFHAYFAPLFGRREARDHSRHYLQALLVQSGDRRNAENLSETVPASARVMQRFLTESPWDDDTVIGRLQEYLGPRLEHPDAVWVLDGSDFPKQGRKSVGVARQYCGRLGKVANCQAGMFLAYVSPLGRALVDKGLYLPQSWTSDPGRCAAAGVPEEQRSYRKKTGLALEMLAAGLGAGPSEGWLGSRGRRFRDVAALPRGAGGTGDAVRPGRSGGLYGVAAGHRADQSSIPGTGGASQTQAGGRAAAHYGRRRKPGEVVWAIWRCNVDGSEPRYYLSNAPADTPLETLAYVGGSRWCIETEFETEKSDVGLDEYETRTWAGWHHHIALCLLGLQQDWEGKMPRITRPQVYRVVCEMLPRERFGPDELLLWLEDTQLRNERARCSHERRRAGCRKGRPGPPP